MFSKFLGKTSLVMKAGFAYTVCAFLSKGLVFLTLPLFTLLLTSAEMGYYNLYMSYETICVVLIGAGVGASVKNATLDFRDDIDCYASSVITINMMLYVAMVLFVNVFHGPIEEATGFSLFVLNVLLLHALGSHFLEFYNEKLSMEFRYRSYGALMLVNAVANVALSILVICVLRFIPAELGRVLGTAIPVILTGAGLTALFYRKGGLIPKLRYWRYALKIGLPIVPHILSRSILVQADRVMIASMVSSAAVGVYSVIYTVSSMLLVLHTALDTAWAAYFYREFEQGRYESLSEKTEIYCTLFSLLTILFMCAAPEIIMIFTSGAEYVEQTAMVYPLILSAYSTFLYAFPVKIELYLKKTYWISTGTAIAALMNIGLNIVLIPLGYQLAAWTTLISYIALLLIHLAIAHRLSGAQTYSIAMFVRNFILCLAVCLAFFFMPVSWEVRYLLFAVVAVAAVVYARRKVL